MARVRKSGKDHPGYLTAISLAINLEADAALEYMQTVYRGAGLMLPPDARTLGSCGGVRSSTL